jgi:hypothetical protein
MSRMFYRPLRAGGASRTYPTRNFATLGPFILLPLREAERPAHFWLALMVAHEIGLSHLSCV